MNVKRSRVRGGGDRGAKDHCGDNGTCTLNRMYIHHTHNIKLYEPNSTSVR